MRKVFKYELIGWKSTIVIPVGAEVIAAEMIEYSTYVWAIVDTDVRGVENRQFYMIAIGEALPDEALRHISTVITPDALVFHVFERVPSSRAQTHINMVSGVVSGSLIQAGNIEGGIRQ